MSSVHHSQHQTFSPQIDVKTLEAKEGGNMHFHVGVGSAAAETLWSPPAIGPEGEPGNDGGW